MTDNLTEPGFIYFDLGNVILFFDHELAAQNISDVSGIAKEEIWKIIFEDDLELQYERGDVTTDEFYEILCKHAGKSLDKAALLNAASDIFELNVSIVPVIAHLKAAGYRLGLLSNTNEAHWEFVSSRHYRILDAYFDTYSLSYELRAIKPERAIYEAAAAKANVSPAEIFFVDDREEHVAGAREAGFDAVQYQSAAQVGDELDRRGVRFNY